ncbi:MAG: Ni/Fe hydrogenase subunit alpha [Pleurocapsa minor GSE-CHR-MK-17-07R]|jgi:NAD-reducing hydrogenase large subunit|nr:Ni/Fe hydrogenase subunit alpha [Pleurocapsa minor GSE-CHR-MK 17-07R]
MTRQIVIDPVTRIEGHAKITIQLDDAGKVQDAHFHVTQLRGFEKFCEGRPFHEMPALMARICGICPVSHLMASAKACDALMRVKIPRPAIHLRQIMNLAQIIQSHALSFFYLSSPDLLLGMDADPQNRNIFGVARVNPALARDGVRMRQFGQQVIELLGGKRIHPGWVVPGGVSEALSADKRDAILAMLPEVLIIAQRTLVWFKGIYGQYQEEIETFANFPSLFLGLANDDDTLEMYDGLLRFVDAEGNLVTEVAPRDYQTVIAEAVESDSYLKSPYYKPLGYPDGMYRVGPLARLNMAKSCRTPLADEELVEFRQQDRNSSFHFHYARLIDILYSIEKMGQLLHEHDILDSRVRVHASPNRHHGVGVSEAPRGTLIHHYEIDDDGQITHANLIIATGHNNLAMNRGVLQVAQRYVDGARITEGMTNRVEAVIRAYDPCLSCSTHAIGQMPLHIQLLAADGVVVDEMKR